MGMRITVQPETFQLAQVFTISRGSRSQAEVLTVRIEKDGVIGWGECVPYARYGESLASVTAQINALGHISHEELGEALPAGAARNAVDCAFWDLRGQDQRLFRWHSALACKIFSRKLPPIPCLWTVRRPWSVKPGSMRIGLC